MTLQEDGIDAEAIDSAGGEPTHGRRSMLSKAAIAAAVGTAVGVSLTRKASAVDGDTVFVGDAHVGTSSTAFSGGTALVVANGNSNTTASKQASIVGTNNVSGRVGVAGHATGTVGGWGVYGRNTSSSGVGVYGLNVGSSGIGVYGHHDDTSTSGTGVLGVSEFGVGIEGSGTVADFRATGSGRVRLDAAGVAEPPGNGSVGTLGRDASGNLWVAVATNSWRKLAGPTTAGAFHAITPTRVYDSRAAAPSPGLLVSGSNRTISVADGRNLDTGAVTAANIVPAGATAIACNVTVAATESQGFLTVNPGGNTTVSSSTINWSSAGLNLANGVIVTLNDERQLTVIAGGGGSTHFLIDVAGYFL